jgi:hypothetical protein
VLSWLIFSGSRRSLFITIRLALPRPQLAHCPRIPDQADVLVHTRLAPAHEVE